MQTDHYDRNRYYIPPLGRHRFQTLTPDAVRKHLSANPGMPPFKRSTDKLILDFNSDYPTVIEHSHAAVARAINEGQRELLEAFATAVPPKPRKVVIRRIRFLLEREVRCIPLTAPSAEFSQTLLAAFVRAHNLKKRFRNSLNDLLHLAVAERSGLIMHSRDQELVDFTNSHLGAPVVQESTGQFRVDLSSQKTSKPRRELRESSGYVNQPWSVRRGN